MYPFNPVTKEQRLKAAFNAVHADLSQQRIEHEALKRSVNDWILHLQHENQLLKQEVKDLKLKMSSLDEKRRLEVLDI